MWKLFILYFMVWKLCMEILSYMPIICLLLQCFRFSIIHTLHYSFHSYNALCSIIHTMHYSFHSIKSRTALHTKVHYIFITLIKNIDIERQKIIIFSSSNILNPLGMDSKFCILPFKLVSKVCIFAFKTFTSSRIVE